MNFKTLTTMPLVLTHATQITLVRLFLAPIVTWLMWYDQWQWATACFIIAIITDFLDGYIARAWHEQTTLGALLDTVSDKVLVISVACALLALPTTAIAPWAIEIILVREVLVMGGALLLNSKHQSTTMPPLLAGKIAMALEMTLLGWVLYAHCCHSAVPLWAVSGVVGWSILSLMWYIRTYFGAKSCAF